MRSICLWVAMCLLSACNLPGRPPSPVRTEAPASLTPALVASLPAEPAYSSPSPTAPPTRTPVSPAIGSGEMALTAYLRSAGNVREGVYFIGDTVEVILESDPVLRSFLSQSIDQSVWRNPPEIEMQVCFALDTPCTLGDKWIQFRVAPDAGFLGGSRVSHYLRVDWLGERNLWIVAQFRTADKNPIPSYSGLDPSSQAQPIIQLETTISGVWNESTPLADLLAPVQTGVAATRLAVGATQTAFPVSGGIDVAPGRGAVGGVAGSTIQVEVAFSASSPFGAVGEMRVAYGMCLPQAIAQAAWEPFASTKTYPVSVAINWTSFALTVQYRDEKGNLSPLYCDETGVEGMPATPTPG